MNCLLRGAGEEGERHLIRLPLLHSSYFSLFQNACLQIHQSDKDYLPRQLSVSMNLALILAGSMDWVGLVLAATRAAMFTDTCFLTYLI